MSRFKTRPQNVPALTYLPQILDLKIVEQVVIPEAAAYPAQLKGDFWVATDMQFYIA